MSKLSIRIVVALLTFSIGLLLNGVAAKFWLKASTAKVSSIEEQWHRLYEASGMTADGYSRHEINERLMCTNRQGVNDAVLVTIDWVAFCETADKTKHEFSFKGSNEYGEFYQRITKSHYQWSLQNLDFLKTIRSRNKAQRYLKEHRDLLEH